MKQKRIFDLLLACLISSVLVPLMVLIALSIFLIDGRPIFFVSKRMRSFVKDFDLIKFRTMSISSDPLNATGGHNSSRVTMLGNVLRKYRLDELPQIINIFRGEMSFVGPRPPLRRYVEKFPEIYSEVLKQMPGVTGLSSIYLSNYEAKTLKDCLTPEETEVKYCRTCIPKKAKLDFLYASNQSICYDIKLIFKTIYKIFFNKN